MTAKFVSIHYRLLNASQATPFAEGIRRVYGDSYPLPEMYDAGYVESQLRAGSLYVAVASNDLGEVVGTSGAVVETPGDRSVDSIATMVDDRYRGQKVMSGMGRAIYEVHNQRDMVGTHLYALAFHDIVQRQSIGAGAVTTGVLPAWFGRHANVTGYQYPDVRRGAVSLYMPIVEAPLRRVYLPGSYAETLHAIYSEVPVPRDFGQPLPSTAPAEKGRYTALEQAGNQQCRIIVHEAGADLPALLLKHRSACDQRACEVIYVELPLGDASIEYAVACARDAGFFYGNLLIERRNTDFLRLQYYPESLAAPDAMALHGERTLALSDFVQADRKSVE